MASSTRKKNCQETSDETPAYRKAWKWRGRKLLKNVCPGVDGPKNGGGDRGEGANLVANKNIWGKLQPGREWGRRNRAN